MKSFMGVLFSILLVLIAGCTSNPVPSVEHQAHAAQVRGDWADAILLWRQALEAQKEQRGFWNEELARPSRHSAVLYYELGRSEGVLCLWNAGIDDLNQALHLDEILHGPVWMDLLELGRLYHAYGDHSGAEAYFDRFFGGMPFDEVAQPVPDELILTCEEAADVAAALGKSEKASQYRDKAASVRNTHPQATVPKDWTPYGLGCSTNSTTR